MIDLGTAKKLSEDKGNRTFTIIGNFCALLRNSSLYGTINNIGERLWLSC